MEVIDLKGIDKVREIAGFALEKKAEDLKVLDLRGLSIMADYFVVCSGESTTQVRAIVDNVEQKMKEQGVRPLAIEGYRNSLWVLMDYGDVILHVFEAEKREFYELEKLWIDAPRVELSDEKGVKS
ncbi:MAG: ribosome silencing factor [Nitrospirae bacterium]|nr:MAG: ribosome silencing factor [Nitrospirota bacterium]